MANLGRRATWMLLTVLALVALIGFEQGVVRGLAAVREESAVATADPQREPVPTAQPLSAPAMDEATVRRIAREEADAAVARARPAPRKAVPKDDEGDATDDSSAPAAAPVAPAPAPQAPLPPAAPTG